MADLMELLLSGLKQAALSIYTTSTGRTMPRAEFTNDRLGILHGITQDEAPLHSSEPPSKRAKKPRSHSGDDKDRHKDRGGERDRERKSKKFRFKKPHRSKEKESSSSSRHTNSTSKPQRDKYHVQLDDDPTAYDDSYIPNIAAWNSSGDPDAAFRESLFDAMADDEGAAFWEGVYGQPIHVYQRPSAKDERGDLEMMDDEDYAKYVREKMWEKSHEHIMEERARRERKRERRREEEEERVEWEREEKERRVREKLRREKRAVEKMRTRWEEYAQYWEAHAKGSGGGSGGGGGGIPWPVASGKSRDVTKDAVEEFVRATPGGRSALADVVKVERIRWHPDKAQQRWGRDALGEMGMRAVTTVFQTLDALWAEYKKQDEKAS